ncbi:hypothetical protein K461DRAFT_219617 [Myriangium duriaei CBS 260.36]|uniref:DUF676 domain-containing protein n=1 Tax=Myriangium duriaei CBS 260.36 TaxID=1168546 RepID=A0A9P4JAD0_9PEZI|nr:hypothetical protein K461DRAFT_219617 [Myriangium duriaei CBS 260.36]
MSQASAWATLHIPFSGQDNRRRSTDSIRPKETNAQLDKRKLLLIYIHGFMGDERSFQSFPAHVHNVVTTLLAESHVVHSKIYPRYRSKNNISIARDDFSRWLTPHESQSTDVILLGHSMGGLLSVEVALMPSQQRLGLQHRILGTLNLDVPFLGMHPRVVKSGLQSLFLPSPDKSANTPESGHLTTTSSQPGPSQASGELLNLTSSETGANFNHAFQNDINLPVRRGWESVLHFVNKHSSNLYQGTKRLVTAHMEFGGAMADYSGLRSRYAKIRCLEESSDDVRKSAFENKFTPARIRFVNYYTACNGRPKREKSPVAADSDNQDSNTSSEQETKVHSDSEAPRSNEIDNKDSGTTSDQPLSPNRSASVTAKEDKGHVPEIFETLRIKDGAENSENISPLSTTPGPAPQISVLPANDGHQNDDDNAPLIQLENSLTSQQGLTELLVPTSTEESDRSSTCPSPKGNEESADDSKSSKKKQKKPAKDHKFCALPPKDNGGNRDPVWVRVFMKDIDEVTAHCGLFFSDSPTYAYLVSDVAERIKEWVQEAESERVVKLMMMMDDEVD